MKKGDVVVVLFMRYLICTMVLQCPCSHCKAIRKN